MNRKIRKLYYALVVGGMSAGLCACQNKAPLTDTTVEPTNVDTRSVIAEPAPTKLSPANVDTLSVIDEAELVPPPKPEPSPDAVQTEDPPKRVVKSKKRNAKKNKAHEPKVVPATVPNDTGGGVRGWG